MTERRRIDLDDRGQLDDLTIDGALIRMIRLERMRGDHFWGAIYMQDGTGYTLKISADKGKLTFGIEDQ